MLRIPALLMVIRLPHLLNFVMNLLKVPILIQKLTRTMVAMLILLHFMATTWSMSAFFEIDSNQNWMRSDNIENADITTKYLGAYYWAVTTATTIGYGDILPTNEFERMQGAIIIFIGVAAYSFIISDLSFIWRYIETVSISISAKESSITNLAKKHGLEDDLTRRLKFFFKK